MPFSSHYPRIWDHNTPTRSSPLSSSRDPTGPPECQKLWLEHAYLLGIICPEIGLGNFQNMVRIIVLTSSYVLAFLDPSSSDLSFMLFRQETTTKIFFGCCIIHMGPIEDLSLRLTFRLNFTLNI